MKLIFTCGGTAGHINPAIAVANMMKERYPDCEILFIGATGHMEEKLVPQAGFELKCLPGSGLSRGKNLAAVKKNIKAVKCVLDGVSACKKLFREFKPDAVIGTGGYASFPALYAAQSMGIPTCVHESNAVPGLPPSWPRIRPAVCWWPLRKASGTIRTRRRCRWWACLCGRNSLPPQRKLPERSWACPVPW